MDSQVRAASPSRYGQVFTIGGSMSTYRTHSYLQGMVNFGLGRFTLVRYRPLGSRYRA